MDECWVALLLLLGQSHPGLDSEQALPSPPPLRAGALGMNDAATGLHPVDGTGFDDRLRLGVDWRRLRLVLAPVRDEPPSQQVERALAGLGVLPDYPELLARRAIVAGRHVAERIASDPVIPRVESIDDFEPELIGRARLDDASTHLIHVGAELARRKRRETQWAGLRA